MLFDLNRVKQNRLRASKMGKKNVLLHSACKSLQGRVFELGLNLEKVMVLGAKERDFPKLSNELEMLCRDHFEREPLRKRVDLILNVLSLHWSNDPKIDLSSQMDSLKPSGVFIGCLFGADTLKELRDSFFRAEVKISGKACPRISPLPEIRDIGNLAQNMGMRRVVADKELVTLQFQGVVELFKSLRAMGESNSMLERKKTFSRRDFFELTEKYYQKNHPYKLNDNNKCGIRATFEIIYFYGEKNK